MKTLKDELVKALGIKDEGARAKAVEKFFKAHAELLPFPGESGDFDKAMWTASKFTRLGRSDESMVKRVVERLMAGETDVVANAVVRLKDLVGNAREAAISQWRDLLAALSWQQMVPAGALRGVGTQMVSLGTFSREMAGANIQVNLGWVVDQDHLRILLTAKDDHNKALPEVELRVKGENQSVVFSRKTNRDGAMVAPAVKVEPGQYQIEVVWMDEVAKTPLFVI